MRKGYKENKALIFLLIVGLCSLAFIIVNGLLDANASHIISQRLMSFLFPDLQLYTEEYGIRETGIRKIAHLLEYGALGMWLWFFKLSLGVSNRKISGWWLVLTVFFVGALDEFLQSRSQRTGRVYDVLIDLLGGLLGMAVAMGIYKLWKLYQNRRKHHG